MLKVLKQLMIIVVVGFVVLVGLAMWIGGNAHKSASAAADTQLPASTTGEESVGQTRPTEGGDPGRELSSPNEKSTGVRDLSDREIAVQFGGGTGVKFGEYIDKAHENPNTKTTIERSGTGVIVRHQIRDPLKQTTVAVDIQLRLNPEDKNQILVERMVIDDEEIEPQRLGEGIATMLASFANNK